MIMIDWISCTITTPDPVYTGNRTSNIGLELSPDGEITQRFFKSLSVSFDDQPSSSRLVQVKTPDPYNLYFSGNPSKFLQNHNLFGSDDPVGLYIESGQRVRSRCGLFPSPQSYDACEFTAPKFSRLDITRSFRFASGSDAQDYIRYVAGTARTRHGAAKLYGSETAQFGQGSRRWNFKIYDKHAEIKKNHKGIYQDEELFEWSKGVVRFELCLRGMELHKINETVALRGRIDFQTIWQYYFNRITFNENTAMTITKTIEGYEKLTNAEKGVYMRWKNGEDLRHTLTHDTFYRHRRAILASVGVDISTPPQVAEGMKKPLKIDSSASGWDPEPLEHRMVTPREELKREYGF